jgi:hypothetical protein
LEAGTAGPCGSDMAGDSKEFALPMCVTSKTQLGSLSIQRVVAINAVRCDSLWVHGAEAECSKSWLDASLAAVYVRAEPSPIKINENLGTSRHSYDLGLWTLGEGSL